MGARQRKSKGQRYGTPRSATHGGRDGCVCNTSVDCIRAPDLLTHLYASGTYLLSSPIWSIEGFVR
jgi:hypothetical protein